MLSMHTVKDIGYFILSCGLLFLSACSSAPKQKVAIKQIYQQSAQYHLPDRNPIIVIPGILGSRLVDDVSGQTVWGAFRANYADPSTAQGRQLIALSLDSVSEEAAAVYTEHSHEKNDVGFIRPDGVLENLELNLAGFPITIQAYAGILTTLGAGGYRDRALGLNTIDYGTDHFTCFQFDYDWRRDIAYNAKKFGEFIEARRREVQAQYVKEFGIHNAEVKFDIAAHSMGALLTRYYLRYGGKPLPQEGTTGPVTWAGAKDIERAVLIAPPNAGSLEAFDQLRNGFNTGRPLLPHCPAAILGTFPSVYQLLPRSRHGSLVWDGDETKPVTNLLEPKLWQDMGWGLAANDKTTQEILTQLLPDIEDADARRQIALKFQAHALQRAKQFQSAIDIPAKPPRGLELFLVAGDAANVASVISIDSQDGDVDVLRTAPGDKTVLRSSALMDERVGGTWQPSLQTPIEWTSVLFVPSEHRKITSNPVFEDNVLYWLLEDPRRTRLHRP